MRTKMVFLVSSITALIITIILIVLQAYYIAAALIIGTLIIYHRELWSLIRKGKLPPIDERVSENTSKSVRNSFVFFATVSVLTILFYIANTTQYHAPLQPDLAYFLVGLLLSVGTVYTLSYIFYDRVESNLDARGLRVFKSISSQALKASPRGKS